MGPPPFGDGNRHPTGYNPTPADLQWGHRLSAMETAEKIAPSMGPPPFGDGNIFQVHPSMGPPPFGDGNLHLDLQWGHRLSAMENGLHNPDEITPSMGPPPFGDGNKRLPYAWDQSRFFGFLQWGHRLSAMETRLRSLRTAARILHPSMGPPPFGDGNVI